MDSFYTFLATELPSITEVIEDPSLQAHEVCLLLSLEGKPVPETFFRLYTSPLDIDHQILMNAVAFFSGANILDVQCDCSNDDKPLCDIHSIRGEDFFHLGMQKAAELDPQIECINLDIASLREEILNAY